MRCYTEPYQRLEAQVVILKRLVLLLLRLLVARFPVASSDYQIITKCMEELEQVN